MLRGDAVSRRLAAIVAAHSSRLMEADEEGTLARRESLRRDRIDSKIALDERRTVKTAGDGILVEFASAVEPAPIAAG
jgi:class 3 adenylate cyclase